MRFAQDENLDSVGKTKRRGRQDRPAESVAAAETTAATPSENGVMKRIARNAALLYVALAVFFTATILFGLHLIWPVWVETRLSQNWAPLLFSASLLTASGIYLNSIRDKRMEAKDLLSQGKKLPWNLRKVVWAERAAKTSWVIGLAAIILFTVFNASEAIQRAEKGRLWLKAKSGLFDDSTTSAAGGGSGSDIGQLPAVPPPPKFAGYNEAQFEKDLGKWLAKVKPGGKFTADMARTMAAECVAESHCEQFVRDKTTKELVKDNEGNLVVTTNPKSSATCRYQILVDDGPNGHGKELQKFKDEGRGDYVDIMTEDGCFNFAYELVMSNLENGKPFNADWVTTEDDAKMFLAWYDSIPERGGYANLRTPGARLTSRGGQLPTLQTPKGWKPGDPIPDNPTGIQPPQAEASASDGSNTQPVSPAAEPKGNDCKEVRIETSLDEVSDFYKIGHHAHIRTEPKGAYWMVFYNKVMISSHYNDQQSYYPLIEGKESVAFQAYKLSPEGDTATIYLTPCSNDE